MNMFQNAKWIKSPINEIEACYEFYKELEIEKPIKSAILSVTAMGMYIAYIDKNRVGNELFTPYWTEYTKRLQYQTYDVTDMIDKSFTLSILASEGWAVGYIRAGAVHRNHYADNISVIFSLKIVFEDDTELCINSDESVKVRTTHVIQTSIYHGETIDRSVKPKELGSALIDGNVKTNIIPQEGEKVLEQDIIYPVELIITPKGEKVIDFGQNLAGYVEITICGQYGDIIEIEHAEILDKDGNFYTANLRTAKQKNTYVLAGRDDETFKPNFTWQGFRYIKLNQFPTDDIDLSCFKAIVVHSDIKRTGDFVCGHEKLNQLYHNIIWGQKGNFIDVPTDCPQRDERMGWTGDAQVFVKTATINYDVEKFFKKWLRDLEAGQFENGGVQWMAPSCNTNYIENVSAAWGDAATIIPWEIYLAYGNKDVLENQFDSMKRWIDYMHKFGEDEFLWLGGKQFGDWLALDNGADFHGATNEDYIASAYFAYSTSLFIKSGEILGKDMSEYKALYKNIVNAIQNKFMKDDVPIYDTQTACAIALKFGLCEDNTKTAQRLADLVNEKNKALTTGFVGTPLLLHALSENGYTDLAYDLLLREEYPSWLYSVNKGATTIWEHWDGIKEDGSLFDTKMNSFNHYAYGAVYDWIFGVSAGIKVLEDGAGYRHITIEPTPDKRLGYLKADVETRMGRIESYWYYKDNKIYYEFVIPEGTVAEIALPNGKHTTICGGKHIFSE